jgi:hypothetical protein
MLLGEKLVIKHPIVGTESNTPVGGRMIFFHSTRKEVLTNGWKEAVVYKGISNNVITLSFRKWAIGSRYDSEPNSIQDFQYTLPSSGEPTEVTVNRYKIRVIHADNNAIKFLLLSGMPQVEEE